MGQPGFMVYAETWSMLYEDYTPEEIGQLFKAALEYFLTGECTEFSERGMRSAFRSVARDIDADRQRYRNKVLQTRYAAYCKHNDWAADDPNKPTLEEYIQQYGDTYNE